MLSHCSLYSTECYGTVTTQTYDEGESTQMTLTLCTEHHEVESFYRDGGC